MEIGKIRTNPLKVNGIKDKKEREERVKSMLKEIGLEETCGRKYPSELSGGQRTESGYWSCHDIKTKACSM